MPAVVSVLLTTTLLHAQAKVSPPAAAKTIALSFDDLPVSTIGQDPSPAAQERAQQITTTILATLKKHHAPAMGFVNEQKLNTPGARDARTSLLEDWLRAGMLLGNHGYSHLAFSQVTLAAYEDDFVRGDVITALLMQMHGIKKEALEPRYYRYPYNDTGETAEKQQAFLGFLKLRGYAIAPMTFENDDWMYTALYEPAAARGDQAEQGRLRVAYLDESERRITSMERVSQSSFGRQIAQIADLHVNQVNADGLDDLLILFERHGYQFVPFDQALADPAYRTRDDYVGGAGVSWLYRWQSALGRKADFRGEPDPPQWVQDAYRKLTVK